MKAFLLLTSLLLSLSYAEARAPKLPTAATGLPAEVTCALRDRIHGSGGYWDSDHCRQSYYEHESVHLVTFVDTYYEYRLNFPYYPHGGYVVMFEMDIFGDARKEKVWQIIPPQDGRLQDEALECYIYDHTGTYCYAVLPFCLNGKKVGGSLIGERRGFDLKYGHDGYKFEYKNEHYVWEQWKLTRESGVYVKWHLLQTFKSVDDDYGSQPDPPVECKNARLTETTLAFTAIGTLKREEIYKKDYENTTVPILQRAHRTFCERFDTMTSPKNQTLLGQGNAMPMHNTYYVTSIYELVMTEKVEWVKWNGEITEALAHWNETREEVMKASRGTKAKQALEKLQSSLKQKPQLPIYPLFDNSK
ncbi:MAG: hypothetical protein IKV92_03720 [Akkermansia sp.]|nr:hypothetical protein [Akkermansia sp.]